MLDDKRGSEKKTDANFAANSRCKGEKTRKKLIS